MSGRIHSVQQQPSAAEIHSASPSRVSSLSQGGASASRQLPTASLTQSGRHSAQLPAVSPQLGPAAQAGRSPNLRTMMDAVQRALRDDADAPMLDRSPNLSRMGAALQRALSDMTSPAPSLRREDAGSASLHTAASSLSSFSSRSMVSARSAFSDEIEALSGRATRSSSTRSEIGDDAAPAPAVALDRHGKPQFSGGEDHIRTLLQQTLGGNHARPFVALHSSADNRQHLLLDQRGRLFSLRQIDNGGYLALHTSQPSAAWQALSSQTGKPRGVVLQLNHGSLALQAGGAAHAAEPLPGKLHQSLLTGVYQQPTSTSRGEGEKLRLHDNRLFALTEVSMSGVKAHVWQPKNDDDVRQLSQQADGQLYAVKDKNTLVNLTSGQEAAPMENDIAAFAANPQGKLALLTEGEHGATQLHWQARLDAPPRALALRLAGEQALSLGHEYVSAKKLGLADDRLFAADHAGKVYSGKLPDAEAGAMVLRPLHSPALDAALGRDHAVQGFATDERGRLHAQVKDALGQEHLAPLASGGFTPGWNLSDALVVEHQPGLPLDTPLPNEVLDMGRQGAMALLNDKVHYLDATTHSWTPTDVAATALKRGLDNHAYVLDKGQVKKLDVNQKTGGVAHGDSNVFALSQARNAPKADTVLAGLEKDSDAGALAVVSAHHYVVANAQGEVLNYRLKAGADRPALPPQPLTVDGLEGKVRDLALDKQQNLFALTDAGRLFRLDKSQWQGQGEGRWQSVDTPLDGRITQLLATADHHVAVAEDGHQQHQLRAGGWQAALPEMPSVRPRAAEAVFQQLSGDVKDFALPGGLTAKLDVQLAGQQAQESRKTNSGFIERLRPQLSLPLELAKNLADGVQHRLKGRDGLKPLYEAQGAVFKQLENAAAAPDGHREDLATRLKALDLGEHGQGLMAELTRFLRDLDVSAGKAALLLGKKQGVVGSDNRIDHGFKPSAIKPLAQSLNLNRSGKDLSKALLDVALANPSSRDNQAVVVLKQLVLKGVDMSYQSDQVAAGARRDVRDGMALAKSQLALDALTVGELHKLTDTLTALSGAAPSADALAPAKAALAQLRDVHYGQHPVKQATDMGFTGFAALEADYDAVKSFLKAFGNEGSAMSVTSKTTLQADDRPQLAQKMKDTVLSLDNGESISFNRNYNAGASTAYAVSSSLANVTLNNVPSPLIPSGGVTGDRTYGLSFSRVDNGIDVSFSRNGGISAKGGMLIGHEPKATKDRQRLDHDHALTFDLRLGLSGTATLGAVRQNGLTMTLSEAEVPHFIDALTSGNANPLTLMQKGNEHRVKEGFSLKFDLDGAFTADGRLGANLADDDNRTFGATARASLGVNLGVNLASAAHEHSVTRSELTEQHAATNNRLRFLNQVSAGGNAMLYGGMMSTNPHTGTLPIGSSVGASATLTVDSKTSHSISVKVKTAEPLQPKDMDELHKSLTDSFSDPETRQLAAAVKDLPEIGEALTVLNRHFAARAPQDSGQYAALRSLAQQTRRHQAAEQSGLVLASAGLSSSYANLAKLDSNGILHALRKLVSDNLPPTNAERINRFMSETPALKAVVRQMQALSNAAASVSLELKDTVKDRVEQGIQDNQLSKKALQDLFRDGRNLRIKSVEFTQSVKKKEGFTFPTPLVGASSSADVSMSKLLGKINFSYGADQETPRNFTLEGAIARANPPLAQALSGMKQQNIELTKP